MDIFARCWGVPVGEKEAASLAGAGGAPARVDLVPKCVELIGNDPYFRQPGVGRRINCAGVKPGPASLAA